jgi:hypothetical protein
MLRGRQELQQPGHLENSPQGRKVAPLIKETFRRDFLIGKTTINFCNATGYMISMLD